MGIHHSPHTHTIPIPMGIPMGIPIPTAALVTDDRQTDYATEKCVTIDTKAVSSSGLQQAIALVRYW